MSDQRSRNYPISNFRASLALLLALSAGSAEAAPITGGFLVPGDDNSLSLIIDGTSNTIVFNDDTNLQTCFQNVFTDIADGTSNTIFIGEPTTRCIDDLLQVPDWQQALRDIIDGTSNTIFIGEGELAGLDGNSRVDICVTNANINDGTSNTIFIGEATCFEGLVIGNPQQASAVAEPGTIFLLAGALLLLSVLRQHRAGAS